MQEGYIVYFQGSGFSPTEAKVGQFDMQVAQIRI